jgi:hypothetical protein
LEIKLQQFSDVIYFDPMSENDILEIEKTIGMTIKPLYREFLLTFGMAQDIFVEYNSDLNSFLEVFDFIKDTLIGYLPIFTDSDDIDLYYFINNNDINDNFIYCAKSAIIDDIEIGKVEKQQTFIEVIEKSISNLEKNHQDRCLNIDKINNVEFSFSKKYWIKFVALMKNQGLKQKTKWKPKYFRENIFGDEVAKFELFNYIFIVERDELHSNYFFELEEPALTDKEKSIIIKTEQLLVNNRIKFDKLVCNLLDND